MQNEQKDRMFPGSSEHPVFLFLDKIPYFTSSGSAPPLPWDKVQ